MATAPRKPHPADDQNHTIVVWHDIPLQVKKKFPMFGFMRALDKSPIDAIGMILSEESLAKLEEVEMDFADLSDLMEAVSEGLGAKNAGN